MIDGRVVHVSPSSLWLARGSCLLQSTDGGQSWKESVSLPLAASENAKARTRLVRRLTRSGVHHVLPGQNDVAFCNSEIFVRKDGESRFVRTASIHGSRPMSVATDGKLICYGEYHANRRRKPVRIFGSWDGGCTWDPIWEFTGVRHVHGVFLDPYTENFWITTGDTDSESALWITADRFRSVQQVLGGSQTTRAVDLVFTADWIYFGSDTPLAQNQLYRLSRGSGVAEALQSVGSSVFFGCKVGRHLFFSTAAEPTSVNRSDRAELWCSADGENWRLLRTFPKDLWSARYFQYGQILFPSGPGDGENLYFTPFATTFDQRTERLSISRLDNEAGRSLGCARHSVVDS